MLSKAFTKNVETTAVVIAAVSAVAFWSLKPIFISIIGDRGDYAEVYIVAGSMAVLTSIIASLIFWKKTIKVIRGGKASLAALGWASISGFFLAMWYYGFYRALYGASKADATVIAFTWPLIAAIAMRIISPGTAGKLKPGQWMLILFSFAGAAMIGISNSGSAEPAGTSGEIIWAFVAAVGSGLYLPFAIKATSKIQESIESNSFATFYSISIANAASLAIVSLGLYSSGHKLRFYAFDTEVIVVCALIGIGTYLIAEVTWTWAFQEYKSLTLSTLPYFSPAVSVILLNLLFDEPVRPIAIVGLVSILFSNLALHANQRSANAVTLTLLATVYVALAAQILPTELDGTTVQLTTALVALFAVLAAFILSRVATSRTQETSYRAALVRKFIELDKTKEKGLADELLRALLEFEFLRDESERDEKLQDIRNLIADERGSDENAQNRARGALATWLSVHEDRISLGENCALWITGVGSMVFVLLVGDETPFGIAGSIVFSAGALLVIFTIRDYDKNNLHGFRNQLRRLQSGFGEIGRLPYIPTSITQDGQLSSLRSEKTVRVAAGEGKIKEVALTRRVNTFNTVYMGTACLVILGAIIFPLATGNGQIGSKVEAPRPGEMVGDSESEGEQIVIADTGWQASSVISRILVKALDENGVDAKVEEVEHLSALRDMMGNSPSVDVHPDLWLDNQAAEIRARIEDGGLVLSNEPYEASQGIYILDGNGTRDSVKDLASLKDDDISSLFDFDGDGKAEIWTGARGWATVDLLNEWIDSDDDLDLLAEEYSETIFKAKLEHDADKGRPALFYGYVPDGIHEEFDLRRLGDIPGDTMSETTDAFVARVPGLADRSMIADRVLSSISFTQSEVSAFIDDVDNGSSADEVAAKWLSENSVQLNDIVSASR